MAHQLDMININRIARKIYRIGRSPTTIEPKTIAKEPKPTSGASQDEEMQKFQSHSRSLRETILAILRTASSTCTPSVPQYNSAQEWANFSRRQGLCVAMTRTLVFSN